MASSRPAIDSPGALPTSDRSTPDAAPPRAFTLVELMMVIAIGLVVAAIAVPRYGNALARYRADLAARRIAADLAVAQSTARMVSADRTVSFLIGMNTYRLVGIGTPTQPTIDTDVNLRLEPYQASIITADFNSATTITFNGFGVPDAAGKVVIRSGNVEKTVFVEKDSGATTIQ